MEENQRDNKRKELASRSPETFRKKLTSSFKRFQKKIKFIVPWPSIFPQEMLVHILSRLDAPSLNITPHVCKAWHSAVKGNEQMLWKNSFVRDFLSYPTSKFVKEHNNDWKRIYFGVSGKLKAMDKMISVNPNPTSYMRRSDIKRDLCLFGSALRDLNKAHKLKREKILYTGSKEIKLCQILIKRAMIQRHLKNKQECKKDVDEAIKLEPNNPEYYIIRGNWAKDDGDYNQAVNDYSEAIFLKPNKASYRHYRALIYRDLKEFPKAIEDLDYAVRVDPYNSEFYCSRGCIRFASSDVERALQDLNEAIRINPDNSDYYHWRGRIYREKGECKEALYDLDQALKITNDNIDFEWRSIILSQLKQNQKALDDINKAIELCPKNSFHYQFKGVLLFGLENYENALKCLNKAVELNPGWSGHYVWRAAIEFEMNETDKSIQDLDRAVRLKPDEISLFWRGLLFLSLGNIDKSINDLKASHLTASYLTAENVHARTTFWLGVVNILLDDKEEGESYLNTTLLRAEAEKKASRYTEPAKIYLLRNDVEQAKFNYKKFIQGFYTIDNFNTEVTHLRLLTKLFPNNPAIPPMYQWFMKQKQKLLLQDVK